MIHIFFKIKTVEYFKLKLKITPNDYDLALIFLKNFIYF